MEHEAHTETRNERLLIILLAALVHGVALFALHTAVTGDRWPATDTPWLFTLTAVAVLTPLTVQMLAVHLRQRMAVLLIGGVAIAFACFAWHHGAFVFDEKQLSSHIDYAAAFAVVSLLLWLMILPFIQFRLEAGHWRVDYPALFATAWRNKITLFEAAAFTGLFWLLLALWAGLFDLLGIRFFVNLFQRPVFFYPVTALTFGVALHLIGSLDRFTSVVLEQIVSVLKWLLVVAGLILTLFTVALVFKWPMLFASGQKAIAAAWLLWLVAIVVLLVNAAYRDGRVERPYPAPLAFALRCAVPLLTIIALTAAYSLGLRIHQYGFTAERVWAAIVTLAALFYAFGYAYAAMRRGAWMGPIGRVNVITAATLIVIIGLALTPVLSPYRIAANSQYQVALANADDARALESAVRYLRFEVGLYGRERLHALALLKQHPNAEAIRTSAAAAEQLPHPAAGWQSPTGEVSVADLVVLPSGHTIGAELRDLVQQELTMHARLCRRECIRDQSSGLFIDLNDDGSVEFVLLLPTTGFAFERTSGSWRRIGTVSRDQDGPGPMSTESIQQSIADGRVAVRAREWPDLVIGTRRFLIRPDASAVRPVQQP